MSTMVERAVRLVAIAVLMISAALWCASDELTGGAVLLVLAYLVARDMP